jgi:hypothetical protein
MGFENLVKAKHELEDAVLRYLGYASVMSIRELEIALGRIADRAFNCKEQDLLGSLYLGGEMLKTLIHLRRVREVKERKFMRVIYRADRKKLIRNVAGALFNQELAAYEQRKAAVTIARQHEIKSLEAEFEDRTAEWNGRPWWRQIFTVMPELELDSLTPMPPEPLPFEAFERTVVQKLTLGDLLIHTLVEFQFPYVESIEQFSADESVRGMSQRLLEAR